MIAMVLVLLVQAGTLAAAVRECGRTAHGTAATSALTPSHDRGFERPAAPLPGPPAQTADAGACASAADIVPRVVVADVPAVRVLPAAPATAASWSDPFLHPVLRPPRA